MVRQRERQDGGGMVLGEGVYTEHHPTSGSFWDSATPLSSVQLNMNYFHKGYIF